MVFNIETIREAYIKLKSYVYYENYNLFIKQQIAEFEDENIEEKLQELVGLLNSYDKEKGQIIYNMGSEICINKLIKDTSFYCMPKKIEEDKESGITVISNSYNEKQEYKIESVTYFINTHVYLHIISILWIMLFGESIDSKLGANVYAYKFNIDKNEPLSLFKPYFNQYQAWRDEAIKHIRDINTENVDVIAFSLDIKEYFYSINIDFEKLKEDIPENIYNEYKIIYDIIKNLIITYSKIVKKYKTNCSDTSLPIGLITSGILANWYLKEFDKTILEELYPSYYGRYVDDILIVLRNYDKIKLKPEAYLKKFFIEKNRILEEVEEENNNKSKKYQLKGYSLYVQENKMKVFDIYADGSKALINNFVNTIKKNSSEFRLLPEEKKVIDDFDEEAYTTIYSDSINKIRSLEDFKENTYGISKYLAKIMFSSKYWDDDIKEIDEITKQITTLFKGKFSLQFLAFWEKVFTYYVIRNQKEYIIQLYSLLITEISKVIFENDPIHIKLIKKNLLIHLNISLLIPLALNPELFNDLKVFQEKIDKIDNTINIKKELIISYRRTNLIRDKFVKSPLINYTNIVYEEKTLLEYYSKYRDEEKFYEIKKELYTYSPRFIHLNECIIYIINMMMNNHNTDDIESNYLNDNKYIEKAIDLFIKINNKKETIENYKMLLGLKNSVPLKNSNYNITKYKLTRKKQKMKESIYPKIGVVSIKVDFTDIEKRFQDQRNLSRVREQQLYKLLNLAIEEKVDILVLPEVSIPYEWMQILSDVSRKNGILIIAGFEHWIINNKDVFNYLAVFIPITHNTYNSCLIKIRNKNCFAHDEIKLMNKFGFQPYKNKKVYYDLYNWNNIYFSCYNCFELADIVHRSIFKSEVDILFASEYNRDVNYFSNIAESIVRDVHCFFIQVNTSDYGDSRIIKPVKTEEKNVLLLKGGENTTILTARLDLKSLRKFQMQYQFDKNEDKFKPTPPNYNQKKAKKRFKEGSNESEE